MTAQIETIIANAVSGAPFFPGPRSTAKANAILAALDAAGFAVVPKEPTRAMLEAGATGSGEGSEVVASCAYEAMIEARPK